MKGLLLLTLFIGVAACSGGMSTGDTAAPDLVSTSPDSSTSTPTTIAPTTTTTVHASTTSLPRANWADQPVIISDGWGGIALGWWDGTDWIQAETGTELPIDGGEQYQVALLGREGEVITGGQPVRACDIHGPEFSLPGVDLRESGDMSFLVEDDPSRRGIVSGVAISAPWEIQPRPILEGEWHPDLKNLAVQLLADRGFTTDSVNNVQSIDADLDGDGALESIFAIEETHLANSESGVYSMVFAVTASGDVYVISESVVPPSDEGYSASFRVSAIADLSGDGLMEVVLHGVAWESSWVTVYEFSDSGFTERIGAGCGV